MSSDSSTAVVKAQERGLVAQGGEWEALKEQARALIKSGFFPRSVNTPEKVIAVMLAGRELGLPPMQSIRAISIVDGKPTLAAETMLALAYQRVPGLAVEVKSSNEGATVTGNRPGGPSVTVTFSKADATAAGLLGKDNWRKYPAAMYRARAISAWCRVVTPDAILGCYTPEELEPTQSAPQAAQAGAGQVIDITTAQEVHDTRPTQEEAAQEHPPEPGENDGPGDVWEGAVAEVRSKEGTGKKSGKPYTLYTVVGADGTEFTTFSARLAGVAEQGKTVCIRWIEGKYGKEIDFIGPAGE